MKKDPLGQLLAASMLASDSLQTVMRPKAVRQSYRQCPECGHKIRGPGHQDGPHHKNRTGRKR